MSEVVGGLVYGNQKGLFNPPCLWLAADLHPQVFGCFFGEIQLLAKVRQKRHLDNVTSVRAQKLSMFFVHANQAGVPVVFADLQNRRKCLQNSDMIEAI